MSQPTRILLSLVAGLLLGLASAGAAWAEGVISIAEPIGGLWLNGLQMTIVPLVVSLLINGIAATAEAARASRIAARAMILFVILLWISSAIAAALMPIFLGMWQLPAESAEALRSALSASPAVGTVPGIGEFIRSIVPTNPVSAAATDNFLPLILFTAVFGFALTRLPQEPREFLTRFFRAVSDVMLVMIGWMLWLGPIGVFALAYVVGARAGAAAFGALLHYVVIVSAVGIVIWLLAYPVALIGARVGIARFARAVAPSQAVAISTQSSLASLPAMLRGAEALGVPVVTSGIVLPLAVAVFRVTGPAMNLAVALYVANWFGVELGPTQIAAGIAAAAITTMGAVSLPGQISFIASIAPICLAIGAPIAPLGVLIAVETIPDIFRTLGNVTMNVAATATVSHRSGIEPGEGQTEEDRLLEAGQ
ncbi:dicarboxylate/amino acid:cation symporter [Allosphingosinicella humi]